MRGHSNRRAVQLPWATRGGIMLMALAPLQGSSQEPFEANHGHRVATANFAATPEAVLAVLTPAGQQAMARVWDIEILSPPSGGAVPGATFVKNHTRAPVQQIWTVVEADAPHRLSYAIFVTGLETWVFEMDLRPDGHGATILDVRHTITSLSVEANPSVQEFFDTFDAYFDGWTAAIRGALSRGL